MEIVYFAHEHPLIFKEFEELTRYSCNACGLYLLSSPSYICTIQDCNFYLHRACTQLPHKLHHIFRDDDDDDDYRKVEQHNLALFEKPRDDNCRCGDCGKLCKNFTYHCSECEFVLHALCGSPRDIQIEHYSHKQHPLAAVCMEALLLCVVCGREHKGHFFSCIQCNFWIHQDCALLPNVIKVEKHNHHLSLVYSGAALIDIVVRATKCLICGKLVGIKRFGFYFCFLCIVPAHIECATSKMKDTGAILHLPIMLDDTFPSLIVRTGLEEMRIILKEIAIQENKSENILEEYHNHPLVLINDTTQESVCNACIKPISPPYYRCSAQSECNFFLHKFCAYLPLSYNLQRMEVSIASSLAFPRWDEFFSLFYCIYCGKSYNGFGYLYKIGEEFFFADLECSLTPQVIKHDSHEQHPLIQVGNPDTEPSCCGKRRSFDKYYCSVCNFSIHADCARLPKIVAHKFDKHPLTLTFTSSSQHHSSSADHFCEFCEEDIDPKYWFYHCPECDQSFHIDCIPSFGKYSKIKFGGIVQVPCHSDHPLTLVRTLSVGSQNCGYCHQIIEGFTDGMALHCADCDFWVHFECGSKSSGATIPRPYELFRFVYE